MIMKDGYNIDKAVTMISSLGQHLTAHCLENLAVSVWHVISTFHWTAGWFRATDDLEPPANKLLEVVLRNTCATIRASRSMLKLIGCHSDSFIINNSSK